MFDLDYLPFELHEPENLGQPEHQTGKDNEQQQANEHGEKQPDDPAHRLLHACPGQAAAHHKIHRHGRGELSQGDDIGHEHSEPNQVPVEGLSYGNQNRAENEEYGNAIEEHPHDLQKNHENDDQCRAVAAPKGNETSGKGIHDADGARGPGEKCWPNRLR